MVILSILCSLFYSLVETKVDPLLGFAFIQAFLEILREYFGSVSATTMRENFDTVYQVRPILTRSLLEITLNEASGRNP